MMRTLREIKEMLEDNLQGVFKTFYLGEVTPVPQSYCPALMVIPNTTQVVAQSTAKDQYVYNITIRIVVDVKKYFSEDGTGDTIKVSDAIVNLVEKRTQTGALDPSCVMYHLRNTETIRGEYYLFNNNINVEYSRLEQGEFPYVYADITLEATTDTITRP